MEKDATEKILEDYEDVFSDIVNVLLFDGRRRVREGDLERAMTRSTYKADGTLREQERDVAKYWKNSNIRIMYFGMENQTVAENDMPYRMIGYDGAAYRGQIYYEKKNVNGKRKRKKSSVRYPVVSLVLYFGTKHWNKAKTLHEALGDRLDQELAQYVNDYRINLFEISFLTEEQVEKFQSDFKIVADYFVQLRKKGDYQPSETKITHVRELLQLMKALTGDERFEEAVNETESLENKGKEPRTMCEVLDPVEQRGIQKGRKEGRKEGIQEGRKEGIQEGWMEGLRMMVGLVRDGLISIEEASKRSGKSCEELKKML